MLFEYHSGLEQLEENRAKKEALNAKIDTLQAKLRDKENKARDHALYMIGLVVEQCFKQGVIGNDEQTTSQNLTPPANTPTTLLWWEEKAVFLSQKNQEAYIRFLRSLRKEE